MVRTGWWLRVPDLNKAIANHNKQWPKWCREKAYRDAMVIFKEKKPYCDRCGRPTTTALHRHEDYLHGFEGYLKPVVELTAEYGCQACNFAEKKGMKPCPSCVKIYAATGGKHHIRYIPQFFEVCRQCSDPNEVRIQVQEQAEFQRFVRKVRDADNAKRRQFYQTVIRPGRVKP